MKLFYALILGLLLALGAGNLNSQSAEPSKMRELLESLKASNSATIQRQQKTLEALDVMKQESETLRILAKRS